MGNEKYFDENVLNYDRYRPTYGKEIFKDIIAYTGINENSRILEIGCGTGNATLPFITTGADVTAIEIGEKLAAYTSAKFAGYDNFRVINLPFEEYKTDIKYDLILSATAFHWIMSDYGYPRCFELLKDGGTLALFWNTPRLSESNSVLCTEIDKLYDFYLPDGSVLSLTYENWYTKRCDNLNSLIENYGYTDREFKLYCDYRTFTADEYIGLLHTYSNHMALPEDKRNEFFGKIRDIITYYGSVEIKDTIDLHIGRK